jgi:hypothetical protein
MIAPTKSDQKSKLPCLRREEKMIVTERPPLQGALVKSNYYSPHSKEPNPQQAEQGHAQMQQCV